jgi:glycosyltransferase involved in cell wall biosynthesis
MWNDILKEVPNAKLYVVGSGRLYNHWAELGPLGVASREYEAMFAKYIAPNGKLIPSVKFCGDLGLEKSEIYYKTTVGVTNFRPESFCLSALDMEACGVPVVNRNSYGVLDTVKHNQTGLLGRNKKEIKLYIIRLLKDRELNIRLGRKAKRFAESEFLPEKLVLQWMKLFDDIINDRPCEYIKPTKNFRNNMKWLRIINRWHMIHHVPTVPVSSVKYYVKRLMPVWMIEFLKKILGR